MLLVLLRKGLVTGILYGLVLIMEVFVTGILHSFGNYISKRCISCSYIGMGLVTGMLYDFGLVFGIWKYIRH